MDLAEFVEMTLLEVMAGVANAQKEWRARGEKGHINPVWGGFDQGSKAIREVSFDVAVTVQKNISSDAKAGIKVVSLFEIGGSAKGELLNSSVSRISFSVPIVPSAVFVDDASN